MLQNTKLLSCKSNVPFAEAMAENLSMTLTACDIRKFRDSEIFVEVKENIRNTDTYVVQSTSNPANTHIMELLITVDTLRRGSARSIAAVMPYFGYARQDRKTGPRTPITAKLVANILAEAGVDRVLTMDLHAGQVQGFFDIPLDNLSAAPKFAQDIIERSRVNTQDITVVSPDVGGVARARHLAKRLGADLAIIDKRRPEAGESEVMNVIGAVEGRSCILIDDIADSAGTLCKASKALTEKGAQTVSAYASHGVLSDPAIKSISESTLTELVITDTIQPRDDVLACDKIRILSVADLFSKAVARIGLGQSVSVLFN